MASPKVEFRCPDKLLAAAESRAAKQGIGLADYLRGLIEADTGASGEIKQGFAAFSQRNLKKAVKNSHKSRRKNSLEIS